MRVTEVKVQNYRAIKECRLSPSPFTCIIGENNAGKSTIMLALSLLVTATKLTSSDFYNPLQPVIIEVTYTDITDYDIARIANDDHRLRIQEILKAGQITLVRTYPVGGGTSELLYKKMMPVDSRFDADSWEPLLKGKKGTELQEALSEHLFEHREQFSKVTTQSMAKQIISGIIETIPIGQMEEKAVALPTGIPNSIINMLPEPILIPAVTDATDEVKTKDQATFGKLIGILLRMIENSDQVKSILESFNNLHAMLNTLELDGSVVDNRLPQVQDAEKLLKGYVRENFPKIDLEIVIPKPEIKQIFSNAQILLNDGIKDTIDTKGDGLKRAVTFALIRSYAEMKKKYGGEAPSTRPYLILFEEPELYLHPTAQRILFDALSYMSKDCQVIVTTHSPAFFSPNVNGTFVKIIKKYPEGKKPYGEVIGVDLSQDSLSKDAFQIICYENNSAAFFASKVVLVEGDSDVCYFKHVAKILNSEWDFDAKNIPVIRLNGKGNVRRFRDFFKKFNVEPYVILDLDAALDDFTKLGLNDNTIGVLSKALFSATDKIAEVEGISAEMCSEDMRQFVRQYTFKEKYYRCREIAATLSQGMKASAEDYAEFGMLFSDEAKIRRLEVISRYTEMAEKLALFKRLYSHNIFILIKGSVEDYQPATTALTDKPTKALNSCKLVRTVEEVISLCPRIEFEEGTCSELEFIFKRIFS